jgi:hypothetical protein
VWKFVSHPHINGLQQPRCACFAVWPATASWLYWVCNAGVTRFLQIPGARLSRYLRITPCDVHCGGKRCFAYCLVAVVAIGTRSHQLLCCLCLTDSTCSSCFHGCCCRHNTGFVTDPDRAYALGHRRAFDRLTRQGAHQQQHRTRTRGVTHCVTSAAAHLICIQRFSRDCKEDARVVLPS